MNRCISCGAGWLRFFGISQTRSEGWVRWTICDQCGMFHKDNTERYLGITKTEPSKAIFSSR